ncbi:MAG: hypothetical protein ACI8XX_001424 [Polaribacter sp.]
MSKIEMQTKLFAVVAIIVIARLLLLVVEPLLLSDITIDKSVIELGAANSNIGISIYFASVYLMLILMLSFKLGSVIYLATIQLFVIKMGRTPLQKRESIAAITTYTDEDLSMLPRIKIEEIKSTIWPDVATATKTEIAVLVSNIASILKEEILKTVTARAGVGAILTFIIAMIFASYVFGSVFYGPEEICSLLRVASSWCSV